MFIETDANDLFESICIVIEAYIQLNIKQYIQPTFHDNVVKDVVNTFLATFNDANFMDATTFKTWIATEVERGLVLFYKHIVPPRSNGPTFIRKKPNITCLRRKINYLQQVLQPDQRTIEWYDFRYRHLTASNIWKVFISDSTRKQLILEKCQPLNIDKFNHISIDSPMHWGQKYEPVSIMLYEHVYNAPISDFGCIPHKTLNFLAASPDGIVTDEKSTRYGRMLEVKNIVNRVINGNSKMEYWIQMQIQMEVCELNECDFLETRFIEYKDKEDFDNDIEEPQFKGRIMMFMTNGGKPLYEYAPLNINLIETNEWEENVMAKNDLLTWVKNIYWKLDQLSCVLVLRNKIWFAAVVPQLKEFWNTIELEKQAGNNYNNDDKKKHTARTKIQKKDLYEENITMCSQCFINIIV